MRFDDDDDELPRLEKKFRELKRLVKHKQISMENIVRKR